MLNKITSYVLFVIIVGMCLFGYFQYKSLKNEIAFWANKAAQNFKLYQISESSYEKQILETNKIKVTSEDLKKQLNVLDRKAVYFEDLALVYQRELGKIKTKPADTVLVNDTTYVVDSRNRFFNENYDDQLFIDGYFQPYDPYNIFITNFKLKSKLDIMVSTDDFGQYFWTVNTNSKYLSAENVNVQILKDVSWKFFINSSLYFTNFKLEKFTGIDIKGGISKGNIGGMIGGKFNFNNDTEYSLGVIFFL